ncbi:hypothetical protein [Microbacterium luticocti]|uniref:hypothetical protein n=1 Tax=Microbacterium luticocti TaxID=451764 RepID=UPI0003FBDE8E|nr:hypothetical protein [Microbacterium luticocti]
MTLTDLARFRPVPPVLVSEPDRVGIAGLPVNLVATAPTQTLHGELFDHAVTVRFTPHHFTWTPGDHTHTTTRSPGTLWSRAGEVRFTPTPTSHIYRDRGTYTATVTVAYTPTVTFDTGQSQTVPGFVTSTSAGVSIRIYEAHTMLVAHTCTEDPTGPGC